MEARTDMVIRSVAVGGGNNNNWRRARNRGRRILAKHALDRRISYSDERTDHAIPQIVGYLAVRGILGRVETGVAIDENVRINGTGKIEERMRRARSLLIK